MRRILFALLLIPALLQAQDFERRSWIGDLHTFAPASIGSNSTTDGISAAYFTDGATKFAISFSANETYLKNITNTNLFLGSNNVAVVALNTTTLRPASSGLIPLGTSSTGWNGLYLSNGTDKWSLVPGVNLLTLAAGTADAADDQYVAFTGGGAVAASRGSSILSYGNEYTTDALKGAVVVEGGRGDNGANKGSFIIKMDGSTRWTFSSSGDITQDATNGGNIVMAEAGSSIINANGISSIPADVNAFGGVDPKMFINGGVSSWQTYAGNNASGSYSVLAKTRKTDGTADTIVQNNDGLGILSFVGADGANFREGANISAEVDGTPGASDMPGRLVFRVTPDGSATVAEAMRISQDKSVTIAAGIKSSATDVGWVVRAGADTACTTTCGANKGCLFGIDAGASAVVACATATADTCLCSQ